MQKATPPQTSSFEPKPAGDVDALLVSARRLQRTTRVSETRCLLRDRNLGLVCASEESAEAHLFHRAAAELGASVSHLRPGPPAGTGLLQTAHVLGRLYDAIECQGLAPALVRQLGREAGVPVFDGLACDSHPTARLAQLLDGKEPLERKRVWILQAALLFALR